jgi:hypothetical protein
MEVTAMERTSARAALRPGDGGQIPIELQELIVEYGVGHD